MKLARREALTVGFSVQDGTRKELSASSASKQSRNELSVMTDDSPAHARVEALSALLYALRSWPTLRVIIKTERDLRICICVCVCVCVSPRGIIYGYKKRRAYSYSNSHRLGVMLGVQLHLDRVRTYGRYEPLGDWEFVCEKWAPPHLPTAGPFAPIDLWSLQGQPFGACLAQPRAAPGSCESLAACGSHQPAPRGARIQ